MITLIFYVILNTALGGLIILFSTNQYQHFVLNNLHNVYIKDIQLEYLLVPSSHNNLVNFKYGASGIVAYKIFDTIHHTSPSLPLEFKDSFPSSEQ